LSGTCAPISYFLFWLREDNPPILFAQQCSLSYRVVLYSNSMLLLLLLSLIIPRDAMRKRGLCCRPVSFCPSVTLVDCIQTAKNIVKPLSAKQPHHSSVWRPAPVPNSRGNPSSETQNTRGWENIGDFRLKSPSISETVRDRPMVIMER